MDYSGWAAAAVAFFSLIATFLIARSSNSKTSRRKLQREAFNDTIKGLCSDNTQDQISSAILLRRYLNRENYAGKQLERYKREALNVISSVLKREKCCVLQKTLADSLSYVLCADEYDFQETNFQNACIKPNLECLKKDIRRGSRFFDIFKRNKASIRLSVKAADFFASDFSYATINFVDAQNAVFYTACLNQTIFRNCILDGADFRSTNLKNAKFKNCSLKRAKFDNAFLVGSVFDGCELDKAQFSNSKGEPTFSLCTGLIAERVDSPAYPRIFISCPGTMTEKQNELLQHISSFLSEKKMIPVSINKANYRERGQVSEISKQLSTCDGCVSLGFQDINVVKGYFREDTSQFKEISDQSYVSPWINIELGIAAGLGLPIFMVQDSKLQGGLYDDNISDYHTTRFLLGETDISELDTQLDKWIRSNVPWL